MNKNTDIENYRQLIILYSVLVFYFNIFSQIIFLVFSRFISFKTLRERAGYGARLRYKMDWLYFVKDDVHWFLIISSMMLLFIYVIIFKRSDSDQKDMRLIAFVVSRFVSNMVVFYFVYLWKGNIFELGFLKNSKVQILFVVNLLVDLGSLIYMGINIST